MSPTDILDVSGATYTYLINGQAPGANWTALFRPGERIRLRFINGSSMSIFDVRIDGLPMTVIQADGNDVVPVTVDEFRISVAETYDVIVQPKADRAYTIFAQAEDRTGFARGTLAPRAGMAAADPADGSAPDAHHGRYGHGFHGARFRHERQLHARDGPRCDAGHEARFDARTCQWTTAQCRECRRTMVRCRAYRRATTPCPPSPVWRRARRPKSLRAASGSITSQ